MTTNGLLRSPHAARDREGVDSRGSPGVRTEVLEDLQVEKPLVRAGSLGEHRLVGADVDDLPQAEAGGLLWLKDRQVSVAGDAVEERLGDALREAHGEKYEEIAEDVGPLPGARELVEFDRFKSVAAWLERGLKRPAVERGLNIPKRP